MSDNIVLLDLDAYKKDEEIEIIKSEKTFGMDLKIGDLNTMTWIQLQSEAEKMSNAAKNNDSKALLESFKDQCFIILSEFNPDFKKEMLNKLNFDQIENLYRALVKKVRKGFSKGGVGNAPENKV